METPARMLHAIQTSGLFRDSKTFVDMSMKVDPDTVKKEFDRLTGNPDKHTLKEFVEKYFNPAGSDTESVTPDDWKERPRFLEDVKQPELRQWALELNGIWKSLVKRTIPDVAVHPERYSVVPLQHSFLVPGGRFREMFYWDTYWSMKGMLLCEMTSTIRDMLRNFASLINRLGYIPNFIRVYSLERSQPPLLASMLELYVEATGDKAMVSEILPALDKEYAFWTEQRSVDVTAPDGRVFKLQRYTNSTRQPRAESYKEDIALFCNISQEADRPYESLRAACESGWDFSSRWLARTAGASLHTIRTSQVLPVDLNSFMYMMETSMARLHGMEGNVNRQRYFEEQAEKRMEAMESLFWNQEHGTWFDYDLELKEQIPQFYLSCACPVWAGCHGSTPVVKSQREAALLVYLKKVGALDFPGGIPTSLVRTGQQWDFPNAWPPLVHAAVMGLARSQDGAVRKSAIKLAQQWLRSNYLAYKTHGQMFEKYDVEKPSAPGGLGEYECQEGFGWTNGVVLDFIHHFRDELDADFLHSGDK